MGECLSFAQIDKYAARLMGQRLLPVLKRWQLKRAIKRLAVDGRKPSLDALKDGATKGVLSRAPYQGLLDSVLDQAVEGPAASRVRAHIKTPEPVRPQAEVTSPKPVSAARIARSIPSTSQATTQVEPEREPKEDPKPETFSISVNPLALLKQHLNNSTPIATYRAELRERVRKDTTKTLLDGICGLWDKSGGTDRDVLRELIKFIELVPDRPLWLRRNVALDCGMPWQLADDSPAIAQHLVATTQLRTRKSEVISATQLLRRDDTKSEICRLWFEQYKRGAHDSDFDDVLTQMGFLPESPIEERVAIALTCGWGERLAFDNKEVLAYLLPLLDDSRLGGEARRAIDNIKNPSTLRALKDRVETETAGNHEEDSADNIQLNDGDSHPIHASSIKSSVQAQPASKETQDIGLDPESGQHTDTDIPVFAEETTSAKPEESGSPSIDLFQVVDQETELAPPSETFESLISADTKTTDQEADSAAADSLPTQSSQGRSQLPKPYLDFRRTAQEDDDWEELSLAAAGWDEEDDPDTLWISKLDRYAGLDPAERRRIISKIAHEAHGDDDWVSELLSEDFSEIPEPSIETQVSLSSLQGEARTRKDDEDDNRLKLEQALIEKGAIISYQEDYVIVSVCHSGNMVETNRIRHEELRILPRWELEDLIECWPSLDQEHLAAEGRTECNLAGESQDNSTADNKDSYLEQLFLDELSHAKLDSASVFLIECASDLLGSERSHHLARHRELLAGLLTFHARERNAEIRAYEEHMEMNNDALRRDSDCIAEAVLEEIVPYKNDVFAARYRFDPHQPFRFATPKRNKKEKLICQSSRTVLELESVEEMQGVVTVLVKSESKNKLESRANIVHVPQDFSRLLRQNLAQQASQWIQAKKSPSNAFLDLLNRQGHEDIAALNRVIDTNASHRSAAISEFLRRSDGISLVIQGPPGSGKTSCAAEIICQLTQAGRKVGVSANSHLAIDTLLGKISDVSQSKNRPARIVKYQNRTTAQERKEFKEKGIRVVDSRSFNMLFDVCGGTAHAFSKSDFDDLFDLLVIDEASQVSLASLMAMARCARNILLVGDQQQLGQPIIAKHPGESGMSCLGYASSDQQTVAKDIGIFLSKSWRMHPIVCNYISTTFYEAKLESHAPNAKNSILSAAQQNGILYLPIEHDSNHVFSLEEAEGIRDISRSLVGGEYFISKRGEQMRMVITWDDIAIMAPYNAQVSLIKRVIGPTARVGTVDKFQGQEALISIYSITTSYADNPGALEFALNKNRVNVALSRSQCMSVIVGSPSLVGILNTMPELEEQRKMFFSLANYISPVAPSDLESRSTSQSPTDFHPSTSGIFRLSQLSDTSSGVVPIPDELSDITSLKIAKKLFRFELSSQNILTLYRYRLYNELSLFLAFCSWDKTEKESNRTKLLLRLASSPTTPPLLLERLAQRGEGKTRQALAANPKTPLHVIKDIISRESLLGKRGAAENPGLPEEFYNDLFFEDDELVGRALAGNPNTPLDILSLLAESQYELTKSRAEVNLLARSGIHAELNSTGNAAGDMSTLYSLQSDTPHSLASNPSVPPSHLASLVSSKDQRVRSALAANPSLANEDIRRLAFDSNDTVRYALASRQDLPPDVIRALACDQSRFVRRILAENPTCTHEALKRLVSDSDVYVRERVAKLASLPPKICSWILSDTEERVFLAFADNDKIPASIFAEAQKKYYVECLQGQSPSSLKALLLLSQDCPIDALSDVCIPSSTEIRLALALIPGCPFELLSELARDGDAAVASVAAKRLSQAS